MLAGLPEDREVAIIDGIIEEVREGRRGGPAVQNSRPCRTWLSISP